MNKLFFTAAACLLLVTGYSQSTAKSLSTKITDVTVFMSGAQITENGSVQLKEGENQIKITDLTLNLDPNSITVEGSNAYTILSVKHQVNYLQDISTNPKLKALQDSLDNAHFRQKEIAGLQDVVSQEKAFMEYNRTIKGTGVLVPEDLKDMADFYRARYTELSYRWIELGEQERLNNQEVTRLQNALNNMNVRKGSNPSEILITLIASKSATVPIKVSYLARTAGWYPVYDLRAEDVNSPIDFAYRAKVFQSTGKDWEDVKLTISTGNPTVGGQIPVLNPWYVSIYEPVNYGYKMESTSDDTRSATPSVAYDKNSESLGENPYTGATYTTISKNTVNTEFKISIPYSIPSDNQQYDVTMQSETLKAEYAYITIPKLDSDAFLRAQITDWAQYSLLPGESNIYFKGTFVGKGFIDPALANDTLNLSLGRDRSINVKRDQIKDYCKTSLLGGKQKTTKAYEITVQNNKKQSVVLIIEDQLPISQSGDIEVETEELSGGQYDTTTGKVVWKQTLAPGEILKKHLRFNVKYPKKKYVSGL